MTDQERIKELEQLLAAVEERARKLQGFWEKAVEERDRMKEIVKDYFDVYEGVYDVVNPLRQSQKAMNIESRARALLAEMEGEA